MDLSFIFSFYFLLAIYMVAFFVNYKSSIYFITFIMSEIIGRFALFSWAMSYEYGAFMHLMWAVIYGACFMFYWLHLNQEASNNKLTMICTMFMILFQFIMVLDCKGSEGNATFLFNNYKYIIVFIHCCIVSSFIQWGNIISFLDEFITSAWRFVCTNGYNLLFWYNVKNNKTTIKNEK